MKYTEEEKEVLKTILENKEKILNIDITNEAKRTLKIVIDIIEKQKNEIEEKDKQVEILDEAYRGAIIESKKWFEITKNSISKEVIRDKIKDYKNIPNLGIFQSKEPIIRVLTELLGDE